MSERSFTPAEIEYLIRMSERQLVQIEEIKKILTKVIDHYEEWSKVGMVVRVLSTMRDSLS